MLVPEAAMHKNCLLPATENQIGFAGEILGMEPIAVPHTVHKAPDEHLRRGVLAVDVPHIFGAAFGGERIHHYTLNGKIKWQVRNITKAFAFGHD
jgi:hypothetical protein